MISNSVIQLEQPVYQKQNNNHNNNITVLPNQNPASSVYDEIDKNPNYSKQHKINKKIKCQTGLTSYHELRKRGIEEYAKEINHYTTEIKYPKYGIIVDGETYRNHQYHIGYSRLEDDSEPAGYRAIMLGFVYKSDLIYFDPDRPVFTYYDITAIKFRNPFYGVKVSDMRNINELYNHLHNSKILRSLSISNIG